MNLNTILVPTDFSDCSRAATGYALDLARRFDAKIILLHVIHDPVVYVPPVFTYVPDVDMYDAYAQQQLDEWITPDDGSGIPIERSFIHGHPVIEILAAADSHNADMIVMGTHGRGMAQHLLMGSVAERVVRKAGCPVLTVREPTPPEECPEAAAATASA